MCDLTTLQKILKKIFCKKIYHTHTYIILHNHINCNDFFKKSVDNFLFFIFENFLKKYFFVNIKMQNKLFYKKMSGFSSSLVSARSYYIVADGQRLF